VLHQEEIKDPHIIDLPLQVHSLWTKSSLRSTNDDIQTCT